MYSGQQEKVNGVLEMNGGDWIEMDEDGQLTGKMDGGKQSRFQVAKVDHSCDNPLLNNKGVKGAVMEDADDNDNDNDNDNDEHDNDDDAVSFANSAANSTHHSQSGTYDTRYLKSLRHLTREALPRIDHYRNILSVTGSAYRPTLDELHDHTVNDVKTANDQKAAPVLDSNSGLVKFGWIRGVLIRCLLNIWGVMLFLRLSWVVGQAGIVQGIIIILLATLVTTLTSLSASAICTNGVVKGGGTYYLISRSLGPEFGGAIGLIFSIANAIACAMYVVGFCESFTDMLTVAGVSIVGNKMHDIRIIGVITIILLLGITVVGMEWETRAQIGLLVILLVAMADFVIGSFIPPAEDEQAKGFVGYSSENLETNWNSEYRGEGFFSVFAVFFPAATGMLAGANISGDLNDPGAAIPKGTLLSILITSVSYIAFAIIAGCVAVRDADGNVESWRNGTSQDCFYNGTCQYGLTNNFQMMEIISAFGPLIYAGCFAATLSSALASLVSAPKVFQALCKDKLYPKIHFFAKGYGKNNEPIRGYVLTFVISLGFILIAELNAIAPIISNFFLASYGLINYSCFHASLVKSPGFRPSFRYYNRWVSLLGALLCLAVMFVINWWTALVTFAICFGLYIYIAYAKPDVNWGSSTQAQSYKNALQSVIKLNQVEEHVKNYRPQILVMTGMPSSRPPLVDFVHNITKNLSLMICGHILKTPVTQRMRNAYSRQANCWLGKRNVKAFYNLVENEQMSLGSKSLIQIAGMGKLKPNLLMLGYKTNWRFCESQEVLDYFNIIHEAFDNYMAVGILRIQEGLDFSHILEEDDIMSTAAYLAVPNQNLSSSVDSNMHLRYNLSSSQLSTGINSTENSPPSTPTANRMPSFNVSTNPDGMVQGGDGTQLIKTQPEKEIPKDVLSTVNQFQRKQKKGSIDVWWLYDDGGLTLLLPYILSTRKQWSSCKLRVFSLANRKDELDKEHRNMAALLSKFRIDYSDVVVVPDISKRPSDASVYEFKLLVEKFEEVEGRESDSNNKLVITESELLALKDKTNRHIRLREQLLKYSSTSTLIIMTLPMPRKGTVSAALYMAWLETLTKDMPPFLLVRGNQTSVLTFYS